MGVPPTLRFVFETSERIEINLLKEKAAMGFLKEEKPQRNLSRHELVFQFIPLTPQLCVSYVVSPGIYEKIARRASLPQHKLEVFVRDVA